MGNAWIALRLPGGSAYCPFILETKLDTYMGPSVRCIAGNRNPTIFNIIRWVAGSVGRTTHPPSVWCSKYYFFHNFLQNSLQNTFQFIFQFSHKFTKIKIKSFQCPKSKEIIKKIMLGTSDAWSMSHSSQRPSDPATQHIILKIVGFLKGRWVKI